MGTSQPCHSFKSLVGGMLCCCNSPNKYERLDSKLERKMIEVKQSTLGAGYTKFRSMNSIIMRCPQFKDSLKEIRGVFEQYGEDSNGTIDREELTKCLQKLQFHCTDQEIDDLFESCDMNGSEGIQFNEFIVLLCLIYLLVDPSTSSYTVTILNTSTMGSPELKATFDSIIEAFLFLDKNGDGKLNKKDMLKAMNEGSLEKSPIHITRTRFKEMYWDRNGNVSFREFLYSLINLVGIDANDETQMAESAE